MNPETIRFIFPKVKNRIYLGKNQIWQYCNVESKSLVGYSGFESASVFKERLQTMFGTFSGENLAGISKEERHVILSSAEHALRHEFDLLGSGIIQLDPIDWQIDFKSGVRWSKSFYRSIRTPKDADIKVPWELSRCQHLLWLGEAWLLTKETRFAQEVIDEINWWIDDNPLMYSVNWKCSMDVAFRAVNWLYSLNMINGYEGFDNSFSEKVTRSLWQHGFFIFNNLERQIPFSNNHYASDIVGLLYVGVLFKQVATKGTKWFQFALNEYFSEVRKQVFGTGIHYERSVSYHRMMTELFSYPAYLLARIKEQIPDDIQLRIKKMFEYVANYTKPNGLAPLIADNDDGRFAPFLKRDFRIHNYLNDASSVENRFVAQGCSLSFFSDADDGGFFSDAGVAIIRYDNNYLFVSNGGYSKCPQESEMLIGTHTHNDWLSFELSLKGKDIIVDSGTYLYTSSRFDRDCFRSTAKHNTVVVDDEEQNGFPSAFTLKRNVRNGMFKEISNRVVEGGYTTLSGQMHHFRRFNFVSDQLIIEDTISKTGRNHEAKLFFHFAVGLDPVISDNNTLLISNVSVSFDINPTKLEIIDDTFSPSYGVLYKNKTGVASFSFNDKIIITTKINRLV